MQSRLPAKFDDGPRLEPGSEGMNEILSPLIHPNRQSTNEVWVTIAQPVADAEPSPNDGYLARIN